MFSYLMYDCGIFVIPAFGSKRLRLTAVFLVRLAEIEMRLFLYCPHKVRAEKTAIGNDFLSLYTNFHATNTSF